MEEVAKICYQISMFGTRWEKRAFKILALKLLSKRYFYACKALLFVFSPNRSADGTEQISFGELFKLNEKISNKCVGILQRARKHRYTCPAMIITTGSR